MAVKKHTPESERREFVPPDYFRVLEKEEIFPDPGRPFEVDLGCGDGTFLVEMAAHFPERDFLGVERLLGRARKVCRKAARAELENLKVLRLESLYTLGWLLPDAAVDRLHLLCPDPWPKAKHQGRRIINQEFIDGIRRVLKPGGEFLFKTDHGEYYEDALAALKEAKELEKIDWPEDAFFYPETDFEKQWKEEGRTIQRARYVLNPG